MATTANNNHNNGINNNVLSALQLRDLLQTEAVDVTSVDALDLCVSKLQNENALIQSTITTFLLEHHEQMVAVFTTAQLASDELRQVTGELQDIYSKIDAPNTGLRSVLARPKAEQERILEARKILLEEGWDSVDVGDYDEMVPKQIIRSESLFLFPKCRISRKAARLTQLLRELLLVRSSSYESYRCARDIVTLYIAIMPAHFRHLLDSVPLIAMLFHNDSMYLAHLCLTLGHQSSTNDESLSSSSLFSFADFVLPLRELAEENFARMIRKQKAILREVMSQAEGFSQLQQTARAEHAETAVQQLQHHLSHLASVWQGALPNHVYVICMGGLIDSVLSVITEQVLEISDIAEEETHVLGDLFRKLLQPLDELLYVTPAGKKLPLASVVPSRIKFTKLIRLFDTPLREIGRQFYDAELREFSANELRSIVQALFSDSPLRREILSKIVDK